MRIEYGEIGEITKCLQKKYYTKIDSKKGFDAYLLEKDNLGISDQLQ